MLAACFDHSLTVEHRRTPEPQPGEALIRVLRSGICNTDLEIIRGYMGFGGVLGHELVGTVEACDDSAWLGARVVAEINLACGTCGACLRGLGRHCPTRRVLGILGKDGCHAEYVTMPTRNLRRVPDGLSTEAAVFTEPLAAAFEIREQIHLAPGARALVLGDGKLGLLITMVLCAGSAETTLIGKHRRKLEIAEAVGARVELAQTAGGDFDVVVEATGSPEGFAAALDAVRARGTVVLKSTYHGQLAMDAARIVIDEINVLGSRCGRFEPAVAALATGLIDPLPLLDATYELKDGLTAFTHAGQRGALKICLQPEASSA